MDTFNINSNDNDLDSIPIFTIKDNNIENLSNQILETYKKQRKLRRNMIAKHGIYYTFGLLYFFAQKWLSEIQNKKVPKCDKLTLPVKLSDNRAENTLYTIRTTDHISQINIS